MAEIIRIFKDYLSRNNFNKCIIRNPPYLYQSHANEEYEYILLTEGFSIDKFAITNIIDLDYFEFDRLVRDQCEGKMIGLPPEHPYVKEFEAIYKTYQEQGYFHFRRNIFRNFVLWGFFILPIGVIFFDDPTIRLILWESGICQLMYWLAQRYFAPRLYQLHAKLLPATKSEYAEGIIAIPIGCCVAYIKKSR